MMIAPSAPVEAPSRTSYSTSMLAACLTLVATAGFARAEAPIRSVTLSSAGVAEFVREVAPGEAAVEIRAPLDDVDDLLKSLVVRGESVSGARIELDGPGALEDAFATLPFAREDLASLETLLARLPGAEVIVTLGGEGALGTRIEGRVLGVSRQAGCADDAPCHPVLALREPSGTLRQVILAPDVGVALTGAAGEDVERALAASAGALGDRGRVLRLEVERDGSAPVLVSYVLAAPVWKTAYRGVVDPDGGVRMQAWAVVENASGEDWADVSLTLSAGSPRTLRADLFARTEPEREKAQAEPGVPLMGVPAPAPAMRAFGMAAESAPIMAMQDVAALDPGVAGVEADIGARFTFPEPVSLEAGDMISLPFLDGALDARAVSRHVGGRTSGTTRPRLVLDLVNDLDVRLPAGIATLYENETGFLGDATVPVLAPGERRAVDYGVDVKTRVEEDTQSNRLERSLVIVNGTVVLEDTEVRTTTYVVTAPADRGRDMILDHPLMPGWEIAVENGPVAFEEMLVDGGVRAPRFAFALAPDEETRLVLRESRPIRSSVALGPDVVASFAAWSGRRMSDADRAFFERATTLVDAVRAADRAVSDLDAEHDRREREQRRLRETVRLMERGSEAHTALMQRILANEERLVALLSERDEAEEAQRQAQAALRAHLASR